MTPNDECPDCEHPWRYHLNLNGCCVRVAGMYCYCQTMPPKEEKERPMPTGWQCPKCGRVYAPYVAECERCNAGYYPSTTGTYTDVCPACGQSRSLPGLTGCPPGSHYATYTLPFGTTSTT